jgi:hypothetical protein
MCLIIWVNRDHFANKRSRIREKYDGLILGLKHSKWLRRNQKLQKHTSEPQAGSDSRYSQQLQPLVLPRYQDTFVQVREEDLKSQPQMCVTSAGTTSTSFETYLVIGSDQMEAAVSDEDSVKLS